MGKFYKMACAIWSEEEVEKEINAKNIFTNILFEQENLQIALYVQEDLIPLYELIMSKKNVSRVIIPNDYPREEAYKIASEFGATILIWDDGIRAPQVYDVRSNLSNDVSMNKGIVGFVTSGTTGYPKIVLKEEASLITEAKIVFKDLGIERYSSIIINVKKSHSYGYLYGVVIPFLYILFVKLSETKLSIYVTQKKF